jgi:transposase
LSRDELIVLVVRLTAQLSASMSQVSSMAGQMSSLVEANEVMAKRLATLEHLLTRNSGNSGMRSSRDDEPGRTPPEKPEKPEKKPAARSRGKQPGAPGVNLAWADDPDKRAGRFPAGSCECGAGLDQAVDLGVVDSFQQHEIPLVTVKVTQYDQHSVRCGCGKVHTAARPEGARPGSVGYGPNLQAWIVFLMVAHYVPVQRCCELLESLAGAKPSPGFVHGMLVRTARRLGEVDLRIRTLITLAYAVCADETPLRVGPKKPRPGRKKAEKYLLVACTEAYTHYLLGDRTLDTFKASVLADLAGHVIVHDRYQNYDSQELGPFLHQLCTQHLLRDLQGAAETYPGERWPAQIADALRTLIHEANTAREQGLDAIDEVVKTELIELLRQGVLVGLSATMSHGDRPGENKARALLEVLRDRPADVLRFAHDLNVPPTSNQAERDLRPAKIQQNISGRLTSEDRTRDRYRIRGYISTAAKHGLNTMNVLREALLGRPWLPAPPTRT